MRVTNHPIEPEELMAYLDGELPADRAAVAAFHLETCEECQRATDDFRGVSMRLSTWQVEPSALEAPALPEKPKKVSFFSRWRWVLATAAACPIVLAIFITREGESLPRGVSMMQAVTVDGPGLHRIVSPMIVRTSQLTVTVKDVDKARPSLDDILKRHDGYVGQLSTQGRSLEATLRVPTDQLDALTAELKQLGHVESESQNGEEVTQQYVDLEARLTNAQNSEKRLTEILRQRTGKLSDVLGVEKEIERVRGEIEQMEAERKSLANRVDFATVTVRLSEEYHAEVPGFRAAAIAGYRTLIESLTGVAMFLLFNGPAALFWSAVLFFPCRWLWRRSRGHLLHH
jgi:hypothetical protein